MNAAEAAYTTVRDGIVRGDHPAGTRLREQDLAARLGISRTPVREALRRLQADGMVTLEPRRGALVANWSAGELDEIFELRALVEGYSARRAATRITDVELAELERLCAAMEEVASAPQPDHEAVGVLNSRFHQQIHRAANGRYVSGMLASLIKTALVMRTFHRYTPEELQRSMGHHRELAAALTARRPDWAEAVMHAHVEAARVTLRREVEQ